MTLTPDHCLRSGPGVSKPSARAFLIIGTVWIITGLSAVSWAQASEIAPQVDEIYRKSIDRAWERAVEGRNPMTTCAMLKGKVMDATGPEAFRALFVCNVDVPVRYFETYLDRVESGEKDCYSFLREITTQLPAMTMSTDALQGMLDAMTEEDQPATAVTQALGDAAQDAMTETGLEDPKRLIKNRLAERVRQLCPNEAEGILR